MRNSDAEVVIERQYLVPMYQHIVVEADNLEEACKKGISDDIDCDTRRWTVTAPARQPSPQLKSSLRDTRPIRSTV
jgi:hypothetical protein